MGEHGRHTHLVPLRMAPNQRQRGLNRRAIGGPQYSGLWIPVHLPNGVEYEKVLDDASATLKSIARCMGAELNRGPGEGVGN